MKVRHFFPVSFIPIFKPCRHRYAYQHVFFKCGCKKNHTAKRTNWTIILGVLTQTIQFHQKKYYIRWFLKNQLFSLIPLDSASIVELFETNCNLYVKEICTWNWKINYFHVEICLLSQFFEKYFAKCGQTCHSNVIIKVKFKQTCHHEYIVEINKHCENGFLYPQKILTHRTLVIKGFFHGGKVSC